MASIRNLKKDLTYITTEIVAECYYKYNTKPDIDRKAVEILIANLSRMYSEALTRANHPDGKLNKKLVRSYYDTLIKDFLVRSQSLLEELDKL